MIFPPLRCPACGSPIARQRPIICGECGGEFAFTNSEFRWYLPLGALIAAGVAFTLGHREPSSLLEAGFFGGALLSGPIMLIDVTLRSPELGTKNNSILPSETFGAAARHREPQAAAPRGSAPPVVVPEGGRRAQAFGYLLGRIVAWVRELGSAR